MIRTVVLSALLLYSATLSTAQDLSEAQKGVWSTVEGLWSAWQKQDVGAVMAYIHPDYSSWSYGEAAPSGFSRADAEAAFKARSVVTYNLTPLTIKVYGDFAFVHYLYSAVNRTKNDGHETKVDGRFTDIFIRQNGRWLFVGDHGGRMWPKLRP